MQAELNPYAPPTVNSREFRQIAPHSGIAVTCLKHGWLTRVVSLSGRVEAEIRYDGWGSGERVFVNNQLVATTSPWHFIHVVVPHIDFQINWKDQQIPASIDVYASFFRLLRITRFTLTVDGDVVYFD